MVSFDTLDHTHLRDFVQRRIRDGVVRRLIGKWLKAGVMEDGNLSYPESGSPQGGCISPILANIYLHYVLDTWFETEVKPRLPGSAKLIRFADDFVIVFTNREAALRVMELLPKRCAEFGLTVHPDKTRLIDFRHPSNSGRKRDGKPDPDTFDLLGFTHYGGVTRSPSRRFTPGQHVVMMVLRNGMLSCEHVRICGNPRESNPLG